MPLILVLGHEAVAGKSAGSQESLAQVSGSLLMLGTENLFSSLQAERHSLFTGDWGFLSGVLPPFGACFLESESLELLAFLGECNVAWMEREGP